MGRQQGDQHAGALLPASGAIGVAVLGFGVSPLPLEHPLGVRVRWCSVRVQLCIRFQPARGRVGCWPGHRHAGAPPPSPAKPVGLGA